MYKVQLRELGFDICGDNPCFLGIIPGITTRKDVRRILSVYGKDVVHEEHHGGYRINNMAVVIPIDQNTHKTVGVMITPYRDFQLPKLVDFISMYGLPCIVVTSNVPTHFDINYPNFSLGTILRDERLTLESDIIYIVLVNSQTPTNRCKSEAYEGYGEFPWLGFAKYKQIRSKGYTQGRRGTMKAIQIRALSAEEIRALDEVYTMALLPSIIILVNPSSCFDGAHAAVRLPNCCKYCSIRWRYRDGMYAFLRVSRTRSKKWFLLFVVRPHILSVAKALPLLRINGLIGTKQC